MAIDVEGEARPRAGAIRAELTAAARRSSATIGAFGLMLLMFSIATIQSSGFASLSNVQALLTFAAFIGLAAMGLTMVIIAGGIDLSVPLLIDFGGIALSQLFSVFHIDLPLAAVIVVMLGLWLGAINGFFVTFLRAPPLVVTLGVAGLIEGYLLAVGTLQSSTNIVPPQIITFADSKVGPIPAIALVWIIIAILAGIVLRRTALGRNIYAVGDNARAARLAGINVDRVRFITYVLSGGTASLAGVMLSGYIQTAYVGMGADYLFGAIAAIALGGTALLGGTGSSWGTVAGACTLTVLAGLLPVLGLSTATVQIVYGVIILAGVYLTRVLQRVSTRRPSGPTPRPIGKEASESSSGGSDNSISLDEERA